MYRVSCAAESGRQNNTGSITKHDRTNNYTVKHCAANRKDVMIILIIFESGFPAFFVCTKIDKAVQ